MINTEQYACACVYRAVGSATDQSLLNECQCTVVFLVPYALTGLVVVLHLWAARTGRKPVHIAITIIVCRPVLGVRRGACEVLQEESEICA